MKNIEEGDIITEEELEKLGYKFSTYFGSDLKVFIKEKCYLYWDFKTTKIWRILC